MSSILFNLLSALFHFSCTLFNVLLSFSSFLFSFWCDNVVNLFSGCFIDILRDLFYFLPALSDSCCNASNNSFCLLFHFLFTFLKFLCSILFELFSTLFELLSTLFDIFFCLLSFFRSNFRLSSHSYISLS